MDSRRRTGAALTFLATGLVFVAGCGVFDPGPQFGAITGNWAGWCCADLLDAGGQWYVTLEEGSSGDVTGTVEYIEAGGPAMQPLIVSGTVDGRHSGARVSLGFRYDDGRRGSFTGEQSSETALRGRMSGWRSFGPDAVLFERTP
ncbi:hypothetical protein [Candidatus Palauibacter sp.]|uniref:hypothetical protein n=1 Tax=Candidatus Palauibacter sp. TaxID=3101350 RepID=UPI003D0C5BD7